MENISKPMAHRERLKKGSSNMVGIAQQAVADIDPLEALSRCTRRGAAA